MKRTWHFDEQNFDKLIIGFIGETYACKEIKVSGEDYDKSLATYQIRQTFATIKLLC